jgi:hypothetical protein
MNVRGLLIQTLPGPPFLTVSSFARIPEIDNVCAYQVNSSSLATRKEACPVGAAMEITQKGR